MLTPRFLREFEAQGNPQGQLQVSSGHDERITVLGEKPLFRDGAVPESR